MRQLASKMRGFTVHHEDLVSAALVDTYEFLSSNWDELPELENDFKDFVTKIARQILNRRISDFFRRFGRVVAVDPEDSILEIAVSSENNDVREFLTNLMEAVSRLNEEEQLLLQTSVFTQATKMNSASRQRLSRLRQKLVADMEEKYGTEIGALLNDIQSGHSAS